MLDQIKPILSPALANPAEVGGVDSAPKIDTGAAFRSILSDSIQQVQNYQATAGKAIEGFLSGENENLHEVALAAQKAELSLDLFLQVRNKLVQAYQEVMRLQV